MAKNDRLHERLLELTGPELAAMDLDLVELELLAGGNRLTLRYALERRVADGAPAEERRIGIDQIARASRSIARAIEAEEAENGEFMPGRYTIEVSSPGIFRRLSEPAHFARFVGERVKVIVDEQGSSREYRGTLVTADDREIAVEDEKAGRVAVSHAAIRKANLDPVLDFGR